MKKISVSIALSLSMALCCSVKAMAQAQNTDAKTSSNVSAEFIPLYYLTNLNTNSEVSEFKAILRAIAAKDPISKGILIDAETTQTSTSSGDSTSSLSFTNRGIVVHGTAAQIKQIKRIIAILDFPRESIKLDMWGIKISGADPEKMAKTMREVNQEIAKTQRNIQKTYENIQYFANQIKVNQDHKNLVQKELVFGTMLEQNRPLSMIDILLLANAAKDPTKNYKDAAIKICEFFHNEYQGEEYNEYKEKKPFKNYFDIFGIEIKYNNCDETNFKKGIAPKDILSDNISRRKIILNFALEYYDFKTRPNEFNSSKFQRTQEQLNSMLNPFVKAINQDINDLFIQPTLKKIQKIARDNGVVYAEVGKVSVSGLNGIHSKVTTRTVSTFETTRPQRLDQIITNAGNAYTTINNIEPETIKSVPQTQLANGLLALASAIV
jgi:hypothetical protein